MLRDPFGDWDWDGIAQLAFMTGCMAILVSIMGATEGDWRIPWRFIITTIVANATLSIIIAMFSILSVWYYEQFRGGVF